MEGKEEAGGAFLRPLDDDDEVGEGIAGEEGKEEAVQDAREPLVEMLDLPSLVLPNPRVFEEDQDMPVTRGRALSLSGTTTTAHSQTRQSRSSSVTSHPLDEDSEEVRYRGEDQISVSCLEWCWP